jgi:predicted O-linked N-acetylglucosamine transferase (SPINDLY family)
MGRKPKISNQIQKIKPSRLVNPSETRLLLKKGLELHQAGSISEAKLFYEAILQKQGNHFDALQLLASIYGQQNNPQTALQYFDRALQIDQNIASVHNNQGNVLKILNRYEEALASYNKAIALKDNFAEAHAHRGNVLTELNRYEEALASYDKAITLKDNFVEAHAHRGNVLRELNRFEEALDSFDKVISLRDNFVEAHAHRGNVLRELNRFEEALASYDKAISLKNDFAEVYVNRGNILRELNRFQEALASYDSAIALKPNLIVAHSNRGNALRDLKRIEDALASYDQAISLKNDYTEAYFNRGNLLLELNRYDQALKSFQQAIHLNPSYQFLLGVTQQTSMYLCDWKQFDENLDAIKKTIVEKKYSCTPFSIVGLLDDPELHKQCSIMYSKIRCPDLSKEIENFHSNKEKPRIAYFSADFHNHATMHLIMDVFRNHDRSKFDFYAFSFGPDTTDLWRAEVKNLFTQFIDVKDKSDQEIAQLAKTLCIDIAIDLKGYTKDSRPKIFSYRAAPIQINYLGFPGTMGSKSIDYIIADKVIIPEEAQNFYTEKVLYLPNCYQPNMKKRIISEKKLSRNDFDLPEDGIVFCSFNNAYKITPGIFQIWIDILKGVKNSVLWLLVTNSIAIENLKEFANSKGVDASRLIFADNLPIEQHLSRLPLADIFLDTFPCNAHTTASDAIRMGLPLITIAGNSFPSRVAASILKTVHLENLIVNDEKSYKDLAIELGNNRNELNSIKDQLKVSINNSTLFDSTQYTRDLEIIYDKIFQKIYRTS